MQLLLVWAPHSRSARVGSAILCHARAQVGAASASRHSTTAMISSGACRPAGSNAAHTHLSPDGREPQWEGRSRGWRLDWGVPFSMETIATTTSEQQLCTTPHTQTSCGSPKPSQPKQVVRGGKRAAHPLHQRKKALRDGRLRVAEARPAAAEQAQRSFRRRRLLPGGGRWCRRGSGRLRRLGGFLRRAKERLLEGSAGRGLHGRDQRGGRTPRSARATDSLNAPTNQRFGDAKKYLGVPALSF